MIKRNQICPEFNLVFGLTRISDLNRHLSIQQAPYDLERALSISEIISEKKIDKISPPKHIGSSNNLADVQSLIEKNNSVLRSVKYESLGVPTSKMTPPTSPLLQSASRSDTGSEEGNNLIRSLKESNDSDDQVFLQQVANEVSNSRTPIFEAGEQDQSVLSSNSSISMVTDSYELGEKPNYDDNLNLQPCKRGPKPKLFNSNGKIIKRPRCPKELAMVKLNVNDESELTRFGNKYVKKGTDEYKTRREKNNEAVKEFRKKNAEQQRIKENEMKFLETQNDELRSKVDSLSIELQNLKRVILQSTDFEKLPVDMRKILSETDSLILNRSK